MKFTSFEITLKGTRFMPVLQEPQYEVKSDKTDHIAMHKGSLLRKP